MSVPDTPVERVVDEGRCQACDSVVPLLLATHGRDDHLDVFGCPGSQTRQWVHPDPELNLDPTTLTAAWAQHLDDTATYAGGFTEPERNGLRAAARMMRDVDVRARVHSTIGGEH